MAGGPLADYSVAGVDNSWLSTGLSGVIGVRAVFRDRRRARPRDQGDPVPAVAAVNARRTGRPRWQAAAGHSHVFFVHADSGVHRLAPECKLVATVLFVFAVVATPREAVWAFALDALIIVGIAIVAHVPLGRLARRLVIELPFLAFAVFLPFIGRGPYVEVGFLSLSEPGLWGAWNIVVKGTIGVAASALLTATTTVPELLQGAGPAADPASRWSASPASWSATARC